MCDELSSSNSLVSGATRAVSDRTASFHMPNSWKYSVAASGRLNASTADESEQDCSPGVLTNMMFSRLSCVVCSVTVQSCLEMFSVLTRETMVELVRGTTERLLEAELTARACEGVRTSFFCASDATAGSLVCWNVMLMISVQSTKRSSASRMPSPETTSGTFFFHKVSLFFPKSWLHSTADRLHFMPAPMACNVLGDMDLGTQSGVLEKEKNTLPETSPLCGGWQLRVYQPSMYLGPELVKSGAMSMLHSPM
mmetsp:Transcript_32098/g.80586  ORF Transcript_32098/g.80586 Transcript_32098/m.80586 type:complete len:253 (-) Transcript_32098:344-1102(-)